MNKVKQTQNENNTLSLPVDRSVHGVTENGQAGSHGGEKPLAFVLLGTAHRNSPLTRLLSLRSKQFLDNRDKIDWNGRETVTLYGESGGEREVRRQRVVIVGGSDFFSVFRAFFGMRLSFFERVYDRVMGVLWSINHVPKRRVKLVKQFSMGPMGLRYSNKF